MIRRILFIFIFAIAVFLAFSEWQTQRFMNPTRDSVIDEVNWFTGYAIPEDAQILFAKRDRPSPLLGDYSSCAAFELDERKLLTFMKKFEALPAEDELWGCPNSNAFDRALEDYQFKILGRGIVGEPDETYTILVDQHRRTVLLIMSIS